MRVYLSVDGVKVQRERHRRHRVGIMPHLAIALVFVAHANRALSHRHLIRSRSFLSRAFKFKFNMAVRETADTAPARSHLLSRHFFPHEDPCARFLTVIDYILTSH